MIGRLINVCALVAAFVSAVGCGGKYSTPTSPSGNTTSTSTTSNSTALTIDIRSTSNAQSFAPNPAAVNQGQTVTWRNADGATHRIVANDGSFDTGDITPGASSRALTLSAGINYHCSIHPSMVGAIGIAAEPPPACTGPYC